MTGDDRADAITAIVSRGLFVEVNGGELEHIATVYKPEGQARFILHALTEAGLDICRKDAS